MHHRVEVAAVRLADRAERPVGGVAEVDHGRAEPVLGQAEDAPGERLVGDGGVAAADARSVAASMMVIVAWPRSYWAVARVFSSGGTEVTSTIVAADRAM